MLSSKRNKMLNNKQHNNNKWIGREGGRGTERQREEGRLKEGASQLSNKQRAVLPLLKCNNNIKYF